MLASRSTSMIAFLIFFSKYFYRRDMFAVGWLIFVLFPFWIRDDVAFAWYERSWEDSKGQCWSCCCPDYSGYY